jgi:phosphatidylglycerophosphate synthase
LTEDASIYKTDHKRDFVDVSALFGRYIAAWIVTRIRDSNIHVLQVTALATLFGLLAALSISARHPVMLSLAAILIQLKNILDTVDGSLARARNLPSAIGRYFDSISDFFVNLLIFWALAETLSLVWGRGAAYSLAGIAFLSQLLQCTYYVHYMVRYLGSADPIGPLDHRHPRWHRFLALMYKALYGWQDALVAWLDRRELKRAAQGKDLARFKAQWFKMKRPLFLNSFLGLGTQLFLISVSLWFCRPDLCLWIFVIPGNLYLVFLIYSRRSKGVL